MPYAHPNDPEQLRTWLLGAARKDAQAFQALYLATSPRLFGFALRILPRHELAEEALQDAFVAIWHAAGRYEASGAAPMSWMTTVVRDKAFDILRRLDARPDVDVAQFEADILNGLEDKALDPALAARTSGEARTLAFCLATLEKTQRQAIALAYFHDISHAEVARQLALPIGTTRTWIRRGLATLKTCLAREAA
ncbi:sigma-70 family RNA polymerase sigma factor [Pseudoduganella plicata]|uniref:RNA polymerase sigma factor n=1 Tax=Pseudoduganella plicata TaxID=321984 RepID=A0A4P7BE00_9BURK|nr:sigma-70 family RNA polymerase sigma factor [Pseudoduganella plicata]QBQ36911.1 sigma-70 family RNA polymerase sigma factor [Pseudoduganella plicata]GGZ07541.1 RNA polymerase sigma factor [Pseudoduganella plicata]